MSFSLVWWLNLLFLHKMTRSPFAREMIYKCEATNPWVQPHNSSWKTTSWKFLTHVRVLSPIATPRACLRPPLGGLRAVQVPCHSPHRSGRVILNHLLHLVDKVCVSDLPGGALLLGCPPPWVPSLWCHQHPQCPLACYWYAKQSANSLLMLLNSRFQLNY